MQNLVLNKEEILRTVKDEGLCKIEGFLDEKQISLLKGELVSTFDQMETGEEWSYPMEKEKSYPFGKICRVQNRQLSNFPRIQSIFVNEWFADLTDQYFQCPNNKALQVFFSHEYLTPSEVDGETRNSVLHVDPYEAFKFMIYLTDCSEENGAFRYIKGSHIDGAEARKRRSVAGLLGDAYRFDKNEILYSKYSEKDVIYASAPAGSLLIFTTDIIHGGGIIKKKGLERIGIICHNRRI